MKNPLTPIQILVLFLQGLALLAAFFWSDFQPLETLFVLLHFLFIYGAIFMTGKALGSLGLPKASRPEHQIITALILFLLFLPLLSWWVFILAGVIAEAAQRLFRVPGGPFFNPAALGTLLLSFIGFTPDWWGTNFSPRFELLNESFSLALCFTLPIAGYVVYRYRKQHIVFMSLLAFCATYFLLMGDNPLFLLLDGTLAFFLLVMAVEPKTSPVLVKEQWLYGFILGCTLALALRLHFIEAYTSALLIANLYHQRKHVASWFNKGARFTPSFSY